MLLLNSLRDNRLKSQIDKLSKNQNGVREHPIKNNRYKSVKHGSRKQESLQPVKNKVIYIYVNGLDIFDKDILKSFLGLKSGLNQQIYNRFDGASSFVEVSNLESVPEMLEYQYSIGVRNFIVTFSSIVNISIPFMNTHPDTTFVSTVYSPIPII